MAWVNPRWGSLIGPDADALRGIFESLSEWTQNPTFGNATNPTIAGGGMVQVQPAALVIQNEWIQSASFVTGSSGWRIKADGDAEFNNIQIRGIFKTDTTGNRIEIYDTGTAGHIDFWSGNGSETAPSYMVSAYFLNRSMILVETGANASDSRARMELHSGPHTGGWGNVTFTGFNNAENAASNMDEHHYLWSGGVARWYGASDAERFAVADAGIYVAGKWDTSGPTQDVITFTQNSGTTHTFVDATAMGFRFWSGPYAYGFMTMFEGGGGHDWKVHNLPVIAGTILRRSGTAQIGPESSSADTKTDIVDLDLVGLENPIWKVKPKRFFWDPEKVANAAEVNDRLRDLGGMAGLLAEDVAAAMPDAVHVNEDGKAVSLEMLTIQAYVVDALHYLERRITDLEKKGKK